MIEPQLTRDQVEALYAFYSKVAHLQANNKVRKYFDAERRLQQTIALHEEVVPFSVIAREIFPSQNNLA